MKDCWYEQKRPDEVAEFLIQRGINFTMRDAESPFKGHRAFSVAHSEADKVGELIADHYGRFAIGVSNEEEN